MIKPYIQKSSNGVIIKNIVTGANLTEIVKTTYLDRLNGNYSDWILHLSRKNWITMSILYKLADIICKEYPENDINWKESLLIAECTVSIN